MSQLSATGASDITARFGVDEVVGKMITAMIVWRLFHAHKDRSYKFKIGPIPVSIKLARLQPFVEQYFGPDPGEDAPLDLGPA